MQRNSFKIISGKYFSLCRGAAEQSAVSEAEEWLLDNFYIIERTAKETYSALSGIKKKHIHYEGGRAAVYNMAEKLVKESGGKTDEYTVCEFLRNKQQTNQLTCDELCLFPLFLKLALIDRIAFLCEAKSICGEEMGKLITSLTAVGDIDIAEKLETLCAVDKILCEKTNDYVLMSDDTKDEYRKAVSDIADKSGKSESDIAGLAARMACMGKTEREKHAGFYLVGDGRAKLFEAVGIKMKSGRAAVLYPWFIISVSIVIVITFYAMLHSYTAAILSIFSAVEIAIALANFIFSRAVKPKNLPRLRLQNGIPESGKTMIAYPVLLSSEKAVDEICERLEVCRAANRDDNLFFALLGDLKDGDAEETSEDEKIIGAATEKILRLNEKYGDVFYLFIRRREFNSVQQKWMGRERKRGALTALCDFLRRGENFSVFVGKKENIKNVKYIITLDGDTVLPIGGARKLVGAAMHPLNRAVTDETRGVVTEGYGIIKPKISIDIESASKTVFSRVYAGQGGIDPYSAAQSDVYMDVFGEAIFTGKGIFDIDAFLTCTKRAIPDNTVLSHDLLEGSYLRCALCSAVEVYDEYPAAFESFAKRQHRWMRGDWQLLPWLLSKVRTASGERCQNPLSALSKWKIFDNLRRSIMPLILAFLLVFPCAFVADSAVHLAVLSALTLILPLFLYMLSALLSGNFRGSSEKRYADVIYGLRAVFYQTSLSFSFLAYNAFISADAAIRTVVRVVFTKKNTLQWVTAADAERGKVKTALGYYILMTSSVCVGAATFFISLVKCREYLGVSAVLGIIWTVAPLVAYFISIEEKGETDALSERSRAMLMGTAEKTWKFFADYTGEQDNFLPPDNIQLRPFKGVAHRTSPTNIGLYMLAVLGARDLEFIDTDEMELRLSKTLETIEKLEKWRGHLLNWYDTRSLKPLYPRYVSSVDSGNFICYLMAVCSGVSAYGGIKSENLVMRMKKIIDETKFGILFDKNKNLFSIGYNIEENRLSSSYYDMLASEARQTVFLSIARGEIEPKNWFRLSRTLTSSDGFKGLASWSGTMFEYFMPLILMRTYKNTLLDESMSFALHCQKKYGKKRRIPWGVSESGFFAFDVSMNYQYKAFGVPGLGLKRGLAKDSVVAPYASLLALMRDRRGAILNLLSLKRMGMYGEYGFYEAADFTASRVPKGEKFAAVKSYMAHHQGMGLASVVNVLCDNIMQKRFEKWPEIKAALPLLQERVPIGVSVTSEPREKITPLKTEIRETQMCVREFDGEYILPPLHVLSNGIYSVILDNRGCGVSTYDEVTLGRKRPSPDENGRGIMMLIKTQDGAVRSAFDGKCVFSSHMAQYHTDGGGIESNLSICVLPEESAEVRRITLVNKSGETQNVEITAFTDVSLTTYEAETAHSAFAGLFVETFYEDGCLLAQRKARDEGEKAYSGFMTACAQGDINGEIQYETDRAAMLSRGGDVLHSLKNNYPPALSETVGNVLDPCFAMRIRFCIKNGESASADFIFGICERISDAKRTARKYSKARDAAAIFEEAYRSEKLRPVKLTGDDESLFLNALSSLYFRSGAGAKQRECMKANSMPLRELWKYGISGTNPIVTIKISEIKDTELLEQVLRAYKFWRYKGIKCDLVILCDETAGYNAPVFEKATELIRGAGFGVGEGVFIFGGSETGESDRKLIIAASALFFEAPCEFKSVLCNFEKKEMKNIVIKERTDIKDGTETEFANEYGGFASGGSEYVINQRKCGETPAPWSNVIANENFGTLLTESGGGFTWYKNSREMRITEWRNDAAADIPTESLVIEENGEKWSPQTGVLNEKGFFTAIHSIGYTKYIRRGEIDCTMTVFVPQKDSLKIIDVALRNNTAEEKQLCAVYSVKPVIGVNKYETRARLSAHVTNDGVICKNVFCDNTSVFLFTEGENGIKNADSGINLAESCGEPIIIYAENSVLLGAGEEKNIRFLFGAAESESIAAMLVKKYRNDAGTFENMKKWRGELSMLHVESGQPQLDFLANHWLLYQVTSCRLWGRSAFYQSGGAFGFRDQLQDVLALMHGDGGLARKQILKAAAHQFTEGDVLHWWHEGEPEKGVRTRFSDDRLWLPYVTAEYIDVTGDSEVLNEEISYISGPAVPEGRNEIYFEICDFGDSENLYMHCKRAIDISLRLGVHGLPLMGSGDWNDGMNLVGAGGKGESVWLAWFLRKTLLSFAPICRNRGDNKTAAMYEKFADDLKVSANTFAWDGEWFMRAFYDDGTPMGSSQNAQCRIDSVSQSWAVISDGTDIKRAENALESAAALLADDVHGIVKLLTPPFGGSGKIPGYIAGYPEGVRENGGQYTHAAVWLAISAAILKKNELVWRLAESLNPINHSKTDILANIYKTESYAMAADVYSARGHEGRGGWTWYTGAAAWMYKLIFEYIFGFKKHGDSVFFSPCVPSVIDKFKLKFKYYETEYVFNVKIGDKEKNTRIKLVNDKKKHETDVVCKNAGDKEL